MGEDQGEECSVEMIDGLLMATQYDLPWREDLSCGWESYDVLQSQEFIRNGYRVIVPAMDHPWCRHDCGSVSYTHLGDNSAVLSGSGLRQI